ncbi:hypothetical protein AL755_04030 (plasmid) [Arthrobacter sp. ERGS1:01]|uniref:hypothetical protein n=1 Tax=Arthrobacter sp. ERGS1:01 TaxID=1704044 RepID=UPI0006B4B5B0|nr:hypothetical protein [Arthrobacter sp. ERGS1:01]ALE04851.1 hypothetical protein AL755_04030 [Arthrobacter sp. ERGS1:01]
MVLLRDHEGRREDGRIEASGRSQAPRTSVDMHGQILLPGLISMHSHVAGGGGTRGYVEGNLTP